MQTQPRSSSTNLAGPVGPAYAAVRVSDNGAAVRESDIALLHVSGRDAAVFLQGQVTSDALHQEPGVSAFSCLLSNTGHLVADLTIHRFTDEFLIETPPGRCEHVRGALERFIVRERVTIEDISRTQAMLTVQGAGAASALQAVNLMGSDLAQMPPRRHARLSWAGGNILLVKAARYPPSAGFDLIGPRETVEALQAALLGRGVFALDEATAHILRVESAVPLWGAELTEQTIPLEAGLDDAISFTKGCYMGQEVIARIRSRGHTNRQLMRLRTSPAVFAGAQLRHSGELQAGAAHCTVTSTAHSPEQGWIGLGYVRREFLDAPARFFGDSPDVWAETLQNAVKKA